METLWITLNHSPISVDHTHNNFKNTDMNIAKDIEDFDDKNIMTLQKENEKETETVERIFMFM